jgi:preprotein translocase subunit SecE
MVAMDLSKFFQKKNDQGGARSSKEQRLESSKKGGQKPIKAKKAEPVKKAVRKADENQTPWWERFRQYLREVVYELRRVVWPSRKETLGSTSVVLVIVIICGMFLGVVDLILSRLIRVFVG